MHRKQLYMLLPARHVATMNQYSPPTITDHSARATNSSRKSGPRAYIPSVLQGLSLWDVLAKLNTPSNLDTPVVSKSQIPTLVCLLLTLCQFSKTERAFGKCSRWPGHKFPVLLEPRVVVHSQYLRHEGRRTLSSKLG